MTQSFDFRYFTAPQFIERDVDPTANDDSRIRYSPGFFWKNTVTNEVFLCVTAAEGNALWVPLSGGSGDNSYVRNTPTTISVGGIPAGSTFLIGNTLQATFDRLLYPFQNPGFTSFSISGQGPVVEVGYTVPAGVTFLWGTSQPANVQPNSLNISDVTGGGPVATGLADDGSQAVTLPSGSIQRLVTATYTWSIQGTNIQSGTFSANYSINWRYSLRFGGSASPTLNGATIGALPGSVLVTGYPGNYTASASGFKYIAFANLAGGQINTIADQLTGFNIPMATSADDPSYSNVDGGGFSYALVSYTNPFGVTTNYRVYRTKNNLGASVTMVVT